MNRSITKFRGNSAVLLFLGICGAMPASPARAQCEIADFTASDAVIGDWFGRSVAIDAGVAIVGAYSSEQDAEYIGKAYVFRNVGDQWQEEATLVGSDYPNIEDLYGDSVAIKGDLAVVGAPQLEPSSGGSSGAVYVYRWNGAEWMLEATILEERSGGLFDTGDYLGSSVATDGDVIAAGMPGWTVGAPPISPGAVFVYRFDGASWEFEQILAPLEAVHNDAVGFHVAIDGDVITASAVNREIGPNHHGSVFVFRYDGSEWIQEQELVVTNCCDLTRFGVSVAIEGDVLVAGEAAELGTVSSAPPGRAHVFRHDGAAWIYEAELDPAGSESEAFFGFSVAISGNTILASTPGDVVGDTGGAALVYRYQDSEWVEDATLTASNFEPSNAYFGHAVAIDKVTENAILGAPLFDQSGVNSGAAYVFHIGQSDCNANGEIDYCET